MSFIQESCARQGAERVVFAPQFLGPMKAGFKTLFEPLANDYFRKTGRTICTYYSIIPGGKPQRQTPEEAIFELTDADIPDIQTGFQYPELLCPAFREKFYGRGLFEQITHAGISPDYADLAIADAFPEVHIFASCPFVFLVDRRRLGERSVPEAWEDLLSPQLRGEVGINGTKYGPDLNVLMGLYRKFGPEAVERLREAISFTSHASQFCRYCGTGSMSKCTVMIVPAFFAMACKNRPSVEVVWPKDGAFFQPMFLLKKRHAPEECDAISDYLLGQEFGQYLADNFYPSTRPDVDNHLDGRTLDWFGWDFIQRKDITELVQKLITDFADVPKP